MATGTDDGYIYTVSELARERSEMFGEPEHFSDRVAEIRDDVEPLDRTLQSFGHHGDLDAEMPRQKREVIFGKGELTRLLTREFGTPAGRRDRGSWRTVCSPFEGTTSVTDAFRPR